jgi:histidine triad (HIT) family protein
MSTESCIFCQIVAGNAPADVLHRDELVVAFRDIRQAAPTHILIVPARHVRSLMDLRPGDDGLLGHMFAVAQELAVQEKMGTRGYRVVVNTGPDGGQTVFHLHLHLLGGRRMHWPPG